MPTTLAGLERLACLTLAAGLMSCGIGEQPIVHPPSAPATGQAGAGGSQGEAGAAGGTGSGGTRGTNIGDIMIPDGGPPPVEAGAAAANEQVVVYAHSGSDLFSVSPQTLQITRIGPFVITSATGAKQYLSRVTDIAVDARGRIVGLTGITSSLLLEIDPATAGCKVIATLPSRDFNGLSWVRGEGGGESLVSTGLDGRVFRIDPVNGAVTEAGRLGGALRSSGDIVSVAAYGTLVTLEGVRGDQLARLDPVTFAATIIGPVGFDNVWGLGFWGNKVFGFTDRGEFILVDPRTGAGSLVRREGGFPFWGAGVTTSVPVID